MDLPHLRTITQAGGRMDPQRVVELATLGRRRGVDLFVMYGQTEATARMAYLPPDLAAEHPTTVGVAVPGGSLEIVDGEVVYSGPNVMLGYADTAADLALGRTVERLHTGDLGRITDAGLLEITGRRSRVAKVLGHRVDLDHVERTLRTMGHDVRCLAGPDAVALVCAPGTTSGDHTRLAERAALSAGIPTRCVQVLTAADLGLDALPHLSSGKVDYATLTELAARARGHDRGAGHAGVPARAVRRRSLGLASVSPEDSFASLGGDSLSYVEVSLHVEDHLGHLPTNWHLLTLRDLEALEAEQATDRRPGGIRHGRPGTRRHAAHPARPPAPGPVHPLGRDERRAASRRHRAHRRHPRPRLQAPGHGPRPARARRLEPGPLPARRGTAHRARARPAHRGAPHRRAGARRHRRRAPAHRAVRVVDHDPAQLGVRAGSASAPTGGSGSSSRRCSCCSS
jgi:acyl carrier protein